MLKKIRDYLNRKLDAPNSKLAKGKFLRVTIAVTSVILLSGFMLSQAMSSIVISKTVSNIGTLTLSRNLGVFWDAGFTNRTNSINWGKVYPGTTKSLSIYVRNEGDTALALSMSAHNWTPSNASNYLTLSWDHDGQPLNAGDVVYVTLSLTVNNSITLLSHFSFTVNLVGIA